jgi:hypothetical protein
VIEYKDSKRIVTSGSEYKVHKFTSTGNTTFAVTGSGDIEYLVVAGGGGHGSNTNYGGGGAGGFRTNVSGATTGGGGSAESTYGVTAQNYTITVGLGGAGASSGSTSKGGDSSIVPASGTSIISTGGGAGNPASPSYQSGGSGGGGDYNQSSGGSATSPTQGYAGGAGGGSESAPYVGGGGGGAGTVGVAASQSGSGTAGNGGDGLDNSITGASVIYAAGGGGRNGSSGTAGSGGSGGIGGAGTSSGSGGGGGTGNVNTGSGGGGGGGAGGTGIVIIRYLTSTGITATGGTITTITETQSKPTDVQDNSILVEKDTAKRYWFSPESTDAENITWDNATLDSFTDSSGTITLSNTSGGWLAKAQSSQTFTSSTGGETVINISAPASGAYLTFGLGKNPYAGSTPSGNEERDTVNFAFVAYSNYLHIKELGVDKYTVGTTWSASDDFKITMSSSGEVKYYVNDVLKYTSLTTASGTFYTHVTGARDGSSATISGTITQVTPATWTKDGASFNETFTGTQDSSWSSSGSKISIDTVNKRLKFNDVNDNTTDYLSKMFPEGALSDTMWTMLGQETNILNTSTTTSPAQACYGAGNSNDNIKDNTSLSAIVAFIGGCGSGKTHRAMAHYYGANGTSQSACYAGSFSTEYWDTLWRESATTMRYKVFSDGRSRATNVLDAPVTITNTLTGLDRFLAVGGAHNVTTRHTYGYVNAIEFWDGVNK